MYQSYFGLAEAPFSIAPDPRYLYMSQRHQEALAHLLYGVNAGGGFVLLTGEVGAGKTTVCRCFLEQIPVSCDVAYIFNPKLTVAELLSTICIEYGIAVSSGDTRVTGNISNKVYIDSINAYLLAAHANGRHTVLIIDEAQNLSAEVLEQLRLLTNLETSQHKLLQIILLGQPELAAILAQPGLRQLAQRIIARYHLGPLGKQEVAAYVQHRLEVAGATRPLFPAALTGSLYRLSRGIPRIINVLCDRALLGAYSQSRERVDHATLKQAAYEVFHNPAAHRRSLLRPLLAGLLLASTALATALYQRETAAPTPAKREVRMAALKQTASIQSPRLPDSLEWPEALTIADSKEMAYAALFKMWGAEYTTGDACKQAQAAGLRCMTARGWLDDLRDLNLPAVLTLRNKQGQEFSATLTGLNDKSATFTIGAEHKKVALGVLAAQWSGHYTLLWRKAPVVSKKLRLGDYGPDIKWLNNQFAQLDGKPSTSSNLALFDEAMQRRVKQFQRDQGLSPDGRVGPQTLMHLDAALDAAAPRLIETDK